MQTTTFQKVLKTEFVKFTIFTRRNSRQFFIVFYLIYPSKGAKNTENQTEVISEVTTTDAEIDNQEFCLRKIKRKKYFLT